jgi:uncharacterized membrane-anchored protein
MPLFRAAAGLTESVLTRLSRARQFAAAATSSPRVERFYWTTILFSQTLGTALGDWVAGEDRGGLGLGYEVGALIFGGALAVVAVL